jgi:hypothetical protein
METVKDHWVTALTLLGTGFLVVVGIALIVTGGDDNSGEVRAYGVAGLLGALAILAGLQGLRTGRPKPPIAYALIVIGMLVLGIGFFWFVLLPSVLALVVLYAGVFRRGLERELKPT